MRLSLTSRRTACATATAVLSLGLLTACSSTSDAPSHSAEGSSAAASAAPAPQPDSGLPADTAAQANTEDVCPYLDTAWLADTNGQRVTYQGTDTRFDTPACIFWSYPEAPQATVIVRNMGTDAAAHAAVDWAAPIDTTEPVSASTTGGWEGGRGVLGPEMSVYAVAKGTMAVLVWSNQQQTLKAELIAQETIKNLGL